MTFGLTSLADLLSWMVAILLGLKVFATIVLLHDKRQILLARRLGATLWWSTKIVPLVATPILLAIALLGHDEGAARVYGGLMLFVLVAVPVAIWRRPAHMRRRAGGQTN